VTAVRREVLVPVAFLVLAVAVPAWWWLGRPAPDAGPPVVSVASPVSPAPSASPGPSGAPRAPSPSPAQAAPAREVPVPVPVRLVVPAIGVDAAVQDVGVDARGLLVVPAQARVVGWYRFSPPPGSGEGASVIAGHVDARGQGPGALFRLRELDVGDRLTVQRQDGSAVRYRVAARQTIVKGRLPVERLFARDGPPRLVVVTCGGPFLPDLGSYRDNVVVVALPEGS